MNTLIFHNPGEIDIRGACIAGLSVKETDNAIGYFGTGLKYSIACILRWGGTIIIYSGETQYTFTTNDINYRGAEFKQIYMNGEPLGFTTEYGKNWRPWQVFRELYANTRDEGGDVILKGMFGEPKREGHTSIYVNCPELVKCYYTRDEIILPANKQWQHETDLVKFTAARANGIYYRNVRVFDRASCYTWNFLSGLTLTEDRTLASSYSPSYYFDQFIQSDLKDLDILMFLLELKYSNNDYQLNRTIERDGKPHTLFERPIEGMYMDWYTIPQVVQSNHSYEFQEACKRLYQRDPTIFSALRPYISSIDSELVKNKLHVMSDREQRMFDKAQELVALFGFADEIARVPIFVQELGGHTLGLYEHGTIYLSPKLFDQGTKQLVATLYEECYHHRTANVDCTYNMQSDLFNIIISLNEEVHKVIC